MAVITLSSDSHQRISFSCLTPVTADFWVTDGVAAQHKPPTKLGISAGQNKDFQSIAVLLRKELMLDVFAGGASASNPGASVSVSQVIHKSWNTWQRHSCYTHQSQGYTLE